MKIVKMDRNQKQNISPLQPDELSGAKIRPDIRTCSTETDRQTDKEMVSTVYFHNITIQLHHRKKRFWIVLGKADDLRAEVSKK